MKYLYYCSECDAYFTLEFPMTEKPEHVFCKECNTELRRVWNSVAVHYRGSDWGSGKNTVADLRGDAE